MLVNSNEITPSGSECNKIGVSYNAFQTESDKCQQYIGSCLNNQIYDLWMADMDRLKKSTLIFNKNLIFIRQDT